MLSNLSEIILHEDEYIIVLDKPSGLMVEPDRNGHVNLLQLVKAYLKKSLPKESEVYAQHIHRIDRPVSGVILFAKQRTVLKNLSEQFAERKVKKYYRALTQTAPEFPKGRLEHWHRKEKKKAALYDGEIEYAEKAILDYTTERLSPDRILWNIELQTGKFHQIRTQLSRVGCPVVGDTLYGSLVPYKQDAIALQAWQLVFNHPITLEQMSMESKIEL